MLIISVINHDVRPWVRERAGRCVVFRPKSEELMVGLRQEMPLRPRADIDVEPLARRSSGHIRPDSGPIVTIEYRRSKGASIDEPSLIGAAGIKEVEL